MLLFGAQVHGQSFDHVQTLWRKTAGGPFELVAAAQEPWSGYSHFGLHLVFDDG